MATPAASATATIIQAAEHFVIEEATSVVKEISAKNAADIKGIVNGVAKEAVAASDDSIADIIQNVEDGALAIGGEIVKAAEGVIEAVENHPELIVEGALAVAIGVASIVQPELIAGSVALIGKMAADASKDTLNQIVLESGNSVVAGVAKGVTEETAELAAQDAAEKAKSAALEVAKEGSKSGVEATVDVKATGNVKTEILPVEGSEDGEKKVITTISGDATAIVREVVPDSKDGTVQGPIIAEETVHTTATATSEIKKDSELVTEQGKAEVVTTNDLTGEVKAVVQSGPVTVIAQQAPATEGAELTKENVALASVDIKALAKEVAREMTELEAAKTAQVGEKTVVSSSGDDLRKAAENLEADIKESAERSHQESPKPEEVEEPRNAPEAQVSTEKKEQEVDAEQTTPAVVETKEEEKAEPTEEIPILAQLGIIHPEIEQEQDVSETHPETSSEEVEQEKEAEQEKEVKQEKEDEEVKAVEASPSEEPTPPVQTSTEELEKEAKAVEDTPILAQLGTTHPETKTDVSETQPEKSPETVVEEEAEPEITSMTEPSPAESEQHVAPEKSKDIEESSPAPVEEQLDTSASEESAKPKSEEPEVSDSSKAQEPEKEDTPAPATSKTLWSADEKSLPASVPKSEDNTNHATTHAALASAHDKIASLSESNDLLHQKLDTMQEALLAITKALTERPVNPPQPTEPEPEQEQVTEQAPESEAEPVSTPENQLVLAGPPPSAVINKRMSVFGTIGWLFGAGSGKAKADSKGKGHKRAQSTPALSAGTSQS